MLDDPLLAQLVTRGVLTTTAAEALAAEACQQGQTVTAWLVRQQLLEGDVLAQALADCLQCPYLDLEQINDAQVLLSLLPEPLIRLTPLLPVMLDGVQHLALADPTQREALAETVFHLGKPLPFVIVAYDKLAKRVARLLHVQEQEHLDEADAPVVRYVEKLLSEALSKRASDIHIESHREHLGIRLRIDGLLYEVAQLSLHLAARLITHLKVLAQMDITERRLPQDGRLQITLPQHAPVDCRLSACPTVHGEKLVLRLLNQAYTELHVDKLGFSAAQRAQFLQAVQRPQGLILVTGPTGSGKTVTLYTALQLCNQSTVNISSVEDPVEIELAGINQVSVHPKIGLNFATVLRAFLRQDPDIIMVGEIRDAETADIAMQAAQTGHLVLSTLHTNSAIETLTRLTNMGLLAYHLVSAISLIIAQRLVRCLCEHCKQPATNPLPFLEEPFTDAVPPLEDGWGFTAAGCHKCQSGYAGRTAIYELLPMTPTLAEAMLRQEPMNALEALARQEGMRTLYENGLDKVRAGQTTYAELMRVVRR